MLFRNTIVKWITSQTASNASGFSFCFFPPGDAPPTPQKKCTDFQNANLLQGTNLKVQFLLFTPLEPSCGQLVQESGDIQNSGFNATLGTKLIIHGFRWE